MLHVADLTSKRVALKFSIMRSVFFLAACAAFLPCLHAQLNPTEAPLSTWSSHGLNEYQKIISVIHLDAVASDTKNLDLIPQIFTSDANASYTETANLSIGIDAIAKVHKDGAEGFITQHLYTNHLISIDEHARTANASYFAFATLFTNPQITPGQYVMLNGYYNVKLVNTDQGWRINYLEYRFFGNGWTGNLTILPPGHPYALASQYEPPGFSNASLATYR